MGAWVAGNFDNDTALDMLGAVTGVIDPEIEGFMKSDSVVVEDLDQIVACVAIRVALVERCSALPPSEDEAKALRGKVLDIFDREFDELEPAEGHKEARRKAIVDTLDELVRLAGNRPAP